MNELLEHKPTRRAHFSLLLNKEEYTQLSALSQSLGMSRGAVLRLLVRHLAQANTAEQLPVPMELDEFWKTFRTGC